MQLRARTPSRLHRLAAALVTLVVVLPVATPAAETRAVCRAACEQRNVAASCQWLARRPQRCVQRAMRACRQTVRQGLPAVCRPPADLPACLTHHGCPYGSLCVEGFCQVVPCTGAPGESPCTGRNTCRGDKCIVGDCAGSTDSCPAGLYCAPADGAAGGACRGGDPRMVLCTVSAHCLAAGPNLFCARGVCAKRRGRQPGRTTTTVASVTTSTTPGTATTTTTRPGNECNQLADCGRGRVCCGGNCVEDPYAGYGVCSTKYTPACRVCRDEEDCECKEVDGPLCDTCVGRAALSGCVDPCDPD